jgi:hypothetical protein
MTTNDPYAPPSSEVRDSAEVARPPPFRWMRIAIFAVLANVAMIAAGELVRAAFSTQSGEAFASLEWSLVEHENALWWGSNALLVVAFMAFFACLAPVRRLRWLHALVLWAGVIVLYVAVLASRYFEVPRHALIMYLGWPLWVPALALAATYIADRLPLRRSRDRV